jgi:Holliday junction DNA helicase RuvA
MISYITGKILKINTGKDNFVDILTSGGVGYRVLLTKRTNIVDNHENISLYTSFHVREDSQTLFGFLTENERDFFEKLLTVSGIGPKLALAILSTYSKEEVEKMIVDGDDAGLSKTSGLGSKGAQKIILELRGKIDFKKIETSENQELIDLKNALKALGFSGEGLKQQLEKGEKIMKKNKEIEIEELIKKVLTE